MPQLRIEHACVRCQTGIHVAFLEHALHSARKMLMVKKSACAASGLQSRSLVHTRCWQAHVGQRSDCVVGSADSLMLIIARTGKRTCTMQRACIVCHALAQPDAKAFSPLDSSHPWATKVHPAHVTRSRLVLAPAKLALRVSERCQWYSFPYTTEWTRSRCLYLLGVACTGTCCLPCMLLDHLESNTLSTLAT